MYFLIFLQLKMGQFFKSPLFCRLYLNCRGADYKPQIPAHRNLDIEILANNTGSQLPEIPKHRGTLSYTFWSWDQWAYGFTSPLVRAAFQMMYYLVLSNHCFDSTIYFIWDNKGIWMLFHNCTESYYSLNIYEGRYLKCNLLKGEK